MSSGGSTVLFGAISPHLRFSNEEKRALRRFARALERSVAQRVESLESRTTDIPCPVRFTCLITNDGELQRLNRDFLGRDYATDVLSFPSVPGGDRLGEIAISSERAQAQAEEFGHGRVEEIQILMLHGVLHLTGMDHQRDAGEMERAEQRWRAQFGLPAMLIERAAGEG